MPEKATLREMAELCIQQAASAQNHVERLEERGPLPADSSWKRESLVWESAGQVLGVMAYFEDDSRKFIADLLARHR